MRLPNKCVEQRVHMEESVKRTRRDNGNPLRKGMSIMKSIKTKMILVVCLLITISLALVGGIVSALMYTSSMSMLQKTMAETATVASSMVYEYLETFKTVANETGLVARLSNEDISASEKRDILTAKMQQYDFLAGNITNEEGKGIISSADISDKEYFKSAMEGQTTVSNVMYNEGLGQYSLVVSAPLWKDGKPNTKVMGVVYFDMDAKVLSDLTNEITVGDTGGTYMIDKDGYTIAHKNLQLVLDRGNTIAELKDDPELAQLAEIEKKMIAGETGFGTYAYLGVNKLMAYAPVSTGQGWSIAVNAELNEFLQSTYLAIIITSVLVLITIIVGIVISVLLAKSITKPLVKIEQAAAEMAKGNFSVQIDHHSHDETGRLADSMRQMISTTNAVLLDTARGLREISQGNFNIAPEAQYIGVFEDIMTAMFKIITDLSETMSQIRMATDQVTSGSEQVSSGAQALAQGATEQASSVQELSASINEVTQQIQNNAKNAATANKLAETASAGLMTSNSQMNEMIGAMSEISSSSEQIGKIIKTIEDIAFQTNILALNAAVEAARAGAAGKGFAVVADEVRNLAPKSSEAAKQTNVLIASSVKSVEHGVKIADETANSLVEVVTGAQEMAKLITEISQASAEQSNSIAQINVGVEQISSVVQTNSATSEQSAAASEELNGQANLMKELVGQFKLLEKHDHANSL